MATSLRFRDVCERYCSADVCVCHACGNRQQSDCHRRVNAIDGSASCELEALLQFGWLYANFSADELGVGIDIRRFNTARYHKI